MPSISPPARKYCHAEINFQFVRPVKWLAVLACLLVGLGVFLEISAVDLTRVVINTAGTSALFQP